MQLIFFVGVQSDSPIQLVTLIDNSKNITAEELRDMKEYIRAALSSYTISPNDVRVSILTYGGKTKQLLHLNNGITRKTVNYYLDKVSVNEEDNDLTSALEFVNKNVFTAVTGSMHEAKNIVLLFATNEVKVNDSDRFVRVYDTLKGRGVSVIAIGNVQKEIVNVINDGGKVINIDTHVDLPYYLGSLERIISLLVGKTTFVLFFPFVYVYLLIYEKKVNRSACYHTFVQPRVSCLLPILLPLITCEKFHIHCTVFYQ